MPKSPALGSNRPVHGANRPVHGAIRPDIQALRALAILSVAVYHFWPHAAPGGFVGVDIFFVISGYLITGALWRQVQADGKVKFAQFWARRARRLLPVSLLVIVVTAFASLFIMPYTRSMLIFEEGSASAAYWQNWLMIFKSTDYLQQNIGSLSPFQHFWSLSVEEQYYIFWPFLVWLVLWASLKLRTSLKARSFMAAGLLTLIVGLSLWASIVLTEVDAPLAYFSTFTRAWEFAGGALIAIVIDQRLVRVAAPKDRHWVWFAGGAALMAASIMLFNHNTPFPSFWAAVPTLGAMLAIYGGQATHRFVPRQIIEWAPVQFFGDISYSFYLWHWPLLVLVPIWYGKDIGNFWSLIVFLAAIGIAYLSKRFVEDPVRFGWVSRRSNGAQIALTFVAITAVLITNSSIGYRATDVLKHSFATLNFKPSLADVPNDVSFVDQKSCSVGKAEDAFRVCAFGDLHGTIQVAMLGDSHMRQYFAPLEVMAQNHHWRLTLISKSACPPLSSSMIPANVADKTCVTWQQGLDGYLKSHKPFDLIIESSSSLVSAKLEHVQKSFAALVSSQLKRGSKWLVIRDNPKPRSTFLACIEAHQHAVAKFCSVSRGFGLEPFDRLSLAVQGLPGVTIADFTKVYCQLNCSPVIGNIIVYRDHSHLTNTFAITLRPEFEAVVPKEFLQ
jgi:peptidoglycan/LPS O-acetylase OafA/YrhL